MFGSISHKPDIYCNVGGVVTGRAIMDYKKEIIVMINGIKKTGTLEYLYTFIKLFLEKWGN